MEVRVTIISIFTCLWLAQVDVKLIHTLLTQLDWHISRIPTYEDGDSLNALTGH